MISALLATREALAEVLCRWWDDDDDSDHGLGNEDMPCGACQHQANAILASGVLDTVRADAWDEGFQRAADETLSPFVPEGPTDQQNPYRTDER